MKTDGGERMSPSRKSKSKGPVKLRVNLAHLGQLLGKTESPSSSSRVKQGLPDHLLPGGSEISKFRI